MLLGGGGGRGVSVYAKERKEKRGEEAEGKVDYLGEPERRAGSTPQALNRKMAEVLNLVYCSELSLV